MGLRLLGTLEVVVGRRQLNISGLRQRVVLAMLALNANRVTSVHDLVEALWNESPPGTARAQIQTCVSSLRKMFGDIGQSGAIHTRSPGYLLEISTKELDSAVFSELVATARTHADAGRLTDAAATLREALNLWRGPALADVDSSLVQRGAARFEDSRLAAIEERVRLDLALGRHEEIIGELAELVEEHPLRERLAGFRMLALYRSGRQADALAMGRRTRTRLVEELGIEPGHELQNLEKAILNRDPSLDLRRDAPETETRTTGRTTPVAERPVIPRQLPASIADFTGRDAQIDVITRILAADPDPSTAQYAVRIVAINGKGGIGKSSLAIRVAHELVDTFPDGLLYGDLHNPAVEDATAAVLGRFLRALGVSGPAMPDDPQERAELYRSLLADKRILVVLDDVTNEEQLRSLLPGSPTCAVIATSRMRLSGLWGAHWVDIDVLDIDQSMEMLAKIIGRDRVLADESAAVELAHLCGGLPLALRIAGARLASRPHWSIGVLVRRLADEAKRLDEFRYRGLELRFNIDLTYRSLTPQAKRLFRLLALVRAPDFAEWTAAALLATDLDAAADVLESLVDARLLDTVEYPDVSVRYRLHNLIRIYALEQLLQNETKSERDEALGRLLSAWLALAEAAHAKEYVGDYLVLHGNAPRWQPPGGWGDVMPDKPMSWWNAEHGSLVAAIRQAADAGMDELCWDLALTSITLFEAGGYFDHWRETSQLGLEVTRSIGNRTGEAAMLYSLGTLHMFLKRLTDADRLFTSALAMFSADGDEHGCALVLRNAAIVDGLVGNSAAMVRKNTESLELMRRVGDRMGEAQVLTNMATFWVDEGDVEVGREMLAEALSICRETKCLRGEVRVLYRFAYFHLHTEKLDLAAAQFDRVLVIVRQIGDRIGEAYALHGLGLVHIRTGELAAAETALREALSLARSVGERLIQGQILHGLGQVGVAGGSVEAEAHILDACMVFEELGATFLHARALILLAQLHAGRGEDRMAREEVDRARRLLIGLDSKQANRWLDQLDDSGSAPHAGRDADRDFAL
ncbi:AfsR/SARP family transcriptional regulator [Actinophytocola sp.]|uniref:AfsR/SARP family transcriptional regulator n=1 Tax=Actinophytocola sp. TaxID=1872138 RepID=UPI002ED576F5